jgi:DNA-3-methyladenine glycosylase I
MTDYKAIFEAIESTVYENAVDRAAVEKDLSKFKELKAIFSDEKFYEITQVVIFSSGFKAATASKYHPGLRKHLPDIATAASRTPGNIQQIIESGDVIKSLDKVEACVNNARIIQKIVDEFGSTQKYIDSFTPFDNMRNLMNLREDIMKRFDRIKGITSFHLMTDLGLPVLKPDLVIMRTFQRLGLLYDASQIIRAIEIGQEFAAATNYPIRYIDIVLVSHGQVEISGGNAGICVDNPKCDKCNAQKFCQYYAQQGKQ